MKAIVLECNNGESAVLREDGIVVKIQRECAVGEEIELSVENKKVIRFGAGARRLVAAAAIVVVLAGTYHYTTVQAASYVTEDGDASVEYVLNRRGQVIGINGLDDEGKVIQLQYEESDLGRCSLTEAMNYVNENRDGEAVFTVVSKNDRAKEHLVTELESWIEKNEAGISGNPPQIYEGTMTDREVAGEAGKTTGEYLQQKEGRDNTGGDQQQTNGGGAAGGDQQQTNGGEATGGNQQQTGGSQENGTGQDGMNWQQDQEMSNNQEPQNGQDQNTVQNQPGGQ